MAKLFNILGYIIIGVLILVFGIMNAPRLAGYVPYVVLSGSMEPAYAKGSICYAKSVDPDIIQEKDVIVFPYSSGSEKMVVHRVVSIDKDAKEYKTKGDANANEDSFAVGFANLKGKVDFGIPLIGFAYELSMTTVGKVLIVALFAVACALWAVAGQVKKAGKGSKAFFHEGEDE